MKIDRTTNPTRRADPTRETVHQTLVQLERVLEAVRRGELAAPSGMVDRLEGAVLALSALLEAAG